MDQQDDHPTSPEPARAIAPPPSAASSEEHDSDVVAPHPPRSFADPWRSTGSSGLGDADGQAARAIRSPPPPSPAVLGVGSSSGMIAPSGSWQRHSPSGSSDQPWWCAMSTVRSEAQAEYLERQQPPPAILDLIIRRLPVTSLRTVSLASYCLLDAVLSLPRPTLLAPGHADEPWWLHFPSRLAPRGDILIQSQLSGDRELTHRCLRIPQGLGLPSGDAPRLIGGHPSHPIFIQGQYCITCSVITRRVHVHALLSPGIPEEDVFVLRGAISTSFLSPEADSATPMLLLATKSHLLGRPLLDYTASWAIGSLRGTVLGTVTDIVFAHQIWYMMDDRRRLYRVSFSELTLDIQEIVVTVVPAQIWRNMMHHWLLSWPSGSILCLCFLASTRHDSYGGIIEEGTYQAYLLQFCEVDQRYFWQKLHYLHSCSVFVNWAQGGLAFAYEYPDKWGLQRDLVYDTDLEVVDLVRVNYIDGLPSQHQNWPSRMWLLQAFPARAESEGATEDDQYRD